MSQMVERATHVVDAFANPDVPLVRHLCDFFDTEADPPFTVTIGPGFHEVRYSSGTYGLLQGHQVVFRPVELGGDASP
jgi:hypothetical protein